MKDYAYIATDGTLFKIGITDDPEGREKQIGARMLRIYRRRYAREIEAYIKEHFEPARGSEWFAVTEAEMFEAVRKCVRVLDDDDAIQSGREPSRRPAPGEPLHQPPFEVPWWKSRTEK